MPCSMSWSRVGPAFSVVQCAVEFIQNIQFNRVNRRMQRKKSRRGRRIEGKFSCMRGTVKIQPRSAVEIRCFGDIAFLYPSRAGGASRKCVLLFPCRGISSHARGHRFREVKNPFKGEKKKNTQDRKENEKKKSRTGGEEGAASHGAVEGK